MSGSRLFRLVLAAVLGGLAAGAAEAAVVISQPPQIWSIDITGGVNANAAAKAVSAASIVGVYPVVSNMMTLPRGFTLATPLPSGTPSASARAVTVSSLTWIQPNDVNGLGRFVGQAQGPGTARYAFGRSSPSIPLVSELDDANLWDGSAATGTNDSNVVAGWTKPKGGRESAVYWTPVGSGSSHTMTAITTPPARNSRATGINSSGVVVGYYEPLSGTANERTGFMFDTVQKTFTDLGSVLVPPTTGSLDEFHTVSINSSGWVAATRAVVAGGQPAARAFITDGHGHVIEIPPTPNFESTFATAISDSRWVVGTMRDQQGGGDSGFLWVNGETFNLSSFARAASSQWTGITAAYDVYTELRGTTEIGTVVGIGTWLDAQNRPVQRAFAMQITLQVPEPQTYLMLALGLLAIVELRMRRLRQP